LLNAFQKVGEELREEIDKKFAEPRQNFALLLTVHTAMIII